MTGSKDPANVNEPGQDAEDWLASLKQRASERGADVRPTLRCRIFGHRWGAWIGGSWHSPLWVVGGATRHLTCKRCGAHYGRGSRPRYS